MKGKNKRKNCKPPPIDWHTRTNARGRRRVNCKRKREGKRGLAMVRLGKGGN